MNNKTLVLGLGNVLMGDEGVGVHVVRALEKQHAAGWRGVPGRRHGRLHPAGAACRTPTGSF